MSQAILGLWIISGFLLVLIGEGVAKERIVSDEHDH